MATISVSLPADGQTIDAADINTPINTIVADYNGNIDNTNIASGANIAGSKLAANSITNTQLATSVSTVTFRDEATADFVASGGVWTEDSAPSLNGDMTAMIAYVAGIRLDVSAVNNRAFTASKDTYVDIGSDGTIDYTEVTNGAASPALAASHMRIAKIVTDGTNITTITQVGTDSLGNIILPTNLTEGGLTAWKSFTPSWTNLTVGNGTNTGSYIQIGKTVFVKTRFVMGSTSSMGSVPTLTLPIAASGNDLSANISYIGIVSIDDAGTVTHSGTVRYTNTTSVALTVTGVGSTYATAAPITSTVPMTWTTNDILLSYFYYDAA